MLNVQLMTIWKFEWKEHYLPQKLCYSNWISGECVSEQWNVLTVYAIPKHSGGKRFQGKWFGDFIYWLGAFTGRDGFAHPPLQRKP